MAGPDLPPADVRIDRDAFRHRWPTGAEKVELFDGDVLFHGEFDERDAATARRTYPGRVVDLDDGALWVRTARAYPWTEEAVRLLRVAAASRDLDALVAAVGDRPVADVAQAIGPALLAATEGAAGALREDVVEALQTRRWPGDWLLASELRGDPSEYAPVPVDLDILLSLTEGDPGTRSGVLLDVRTGEIFLEDDEELTEEEQEDPDRFCFVRHSGSRPGWEDMAEFVDEVSDPELQEKLSRALEGRGAFRRFRDVLHEHGAEVDHWDRFSEERLLGRARAVLAELGYRPASAPAPQ